MVLLSYMHVCPVPNTLFMRLPARRLCYVDMPSATVCLSAAAMLALFGFVVRCCVMAVGLHETVACVCGVMW